MALFFCFVFLAYHELQRVDSLSNLLKKVRVLQSVKSKEVAEKMVYKWSWAHFPQRRDFHPVTLIWRCLPTKCGSMMQCLWVSVSMWVCVVKGDPRLSWLWQWLGVWVGKILSGSDFLWLWWHPDTHTCTIDTHAQASLLLRVRRNQPLALSLSQTHTHECTHPTKTKTHAPKPENYSLACKHWADGLPNDCCVVYWECAVFPSHVILTT